MRFRRFLAIGTVGVIVLLVGVGVAGSSPTQDGRIHACVELGGPATTRGDLKLRARKPLPERHACTQLEPYRPEMTRRGHPGEVETCGPRRARRSTGAARLAARAAPAAPVLQDHPDAAGPAWTGRGTAAGDRPRGPARSLKALSETPAPSAQPDPRARKDSRETPAPAGETGRSRAPRSRRRHRRHRGPQGPPGPAGPCREPPARPVPAGPAGPQGAAGTCRSYRRRRTGGPGGAGGAPGATRDPRAPGFVTSAGRAHSRERRGRHDVHGDRDLPHRQGGVRWRRTSECQRREPAGTVGAQGVLPERRRSIGPPSASPPPT